MAFLYGNHMLHLSGSQVEPGVLLFESTNVSNIAASNGELKHWLKYNTFFIPHAVSSQLVGNCWDGRCLGLVEEVYPNCRMFNTLEDFVAGMRFFAPNGMYEGFSGYSARWDTVDGAYHAIDLYIKPPDMFLPLRILSGCSTAGTSPMRNSFLN